MTSADRTLANAIRAAQRAREERDGRHVAVATITSVEPLKLDLLDVDLTLDSDDVELGQDVRRYDATEGLNVGDVLALLEVAEGEWIATTVVSGSDVRGVPTLAGSHSLLSVTMPPSSLMGENGDYAIERPAWLLYGPKSGGAWPAPHALTGPQGPAGAPGATGAAGAGWPSTISTTLPGSPTNGQVIAFQNATLLALGLVWYLQYWSANPGSYKWSPVGSPVPIWTTTGSPGAFANTTPALLSGPSITLPLAGDYDVTLEARLYNVNAAGAATYATLYRSGGTTGVNINQYQGSAGAATTLVAGSGSRTTRLLGSTASSVIDLRLNVNTGSGNSDYRMLSATPVRVG